MSHNVRGNRVPVLTIRPDNEYALAIEVEQRPRSLAIYEGGSSRVSLVKGEDLYALREFINELPEEAFVRPKDPEVEYVLLKDDDGDWWMQHSNGFFAMGSSDYYAPAVRTIETIEENYGIDAGEPPWVDGDEIVYRHLINGYSQIRRRVNGLWVVIVTWNSSVETRGGSGYNTIDDARVGRRISEDYYDVTILRRGGKVV